MSLTCVTFCGDFIFSQSLFLLFRLFWCLRGLLTIWDNCLRGLLAARDVSLRGLLNIRDAELVLPPDPGQGVRPGHSTGCSRAEKQRNRLHLRAGKPSK